MLSFDEAFHDRTAFEFMEAGAESVSRLRSHLVGETVEKVGGGTTDVQTITHLGISLQQRINLKLWLVLLPNLIQVMLLIFHFLHLNFLLANRISHHRLVVDHA